MDCHGLIRVSTLIGSIVLATGLLGCTAKEPAPPLDEGAQAGGVALRCYKALYVDNRAEKFLNGRSDAGSLSDDCRQQLLVLCRQHVQQVGRQHGGVTRVDFLQAQPDTALRVMQVFLKLTFGDATQEQIVVPMVKAGDEWKMK